MTFKSFPLSSDLVSFSDHSLDGVAGAHRMLMNVTADIHRLDASHNTLGSAGAVALFDGLSAARRRFSSLSPGSRSSSSSSTASASAPSTPLANAAAANLDAANVGPPPPSPPPLWGMTQINLARNEIGDDGAAAAMYYVSKDLRMRGLLLQANRITLEHIVDLVVERINGSNLRQLSLTLNPLAPAAVQRLFALLDTPHLRELHLSTCDLPPSCVPAICDFLRSPRSQKLGILELNANALGRLGVTAILDTLERANFSVYRIGLFANNAAPARSSSPDGAGFGLSDSENEDVWRERNGVWESDEAMSRDDPRSMNNQITNRVPALQARNGELGRRVRTAAARSLAPLRMILHARAPTSEETAARVLADAKERDETTGEPARTAQPIFPLLDLPPEVQIHVARHCSGDPYAMSDDQWARVRAHALDRKTLPHLARRMRRATDGAQSVAKTYCTREIRDAWLEEMQCEWWELEDQRFWDRLNGRAASRRRGISPNGHPDAM